MTEDETLTIKRIMQHADDFAKDGNGSCHRIYVMLRNALDSYSHNKHKELIVNGFSIPQNIIDLILTESQFVQSIKELRALHGLPLKEAKDIADRVKELRR